MRLTVGYEIRVRGRSRSPRKDDRMKRTIWVAIMALVVAGVNSAAAQSLGDYARQMRKDKPQSSTTSRYYDNDNLPTTQQLSVVGPAPAAQPANGQAETKTAAPNSAAAQTEKQQAADELKNKMKEQQDKIDAMTHELDLDQREYRLRAAAFYGDAGNRLRDSAQWDKDDAQYKADMDAKQKAIDEAKHQLDELQEQARKAGVEHDIEKGKDNEKEKSNDKDKE